MPNSSKRKQTLVGWCCSNADHYTNIQLQKILFFYECFSKIEGDAYELEGLKGYINGPVFSETFGDIRYEENFKNDCCAMFALNTDLVNDRRAKLSGFLAKSLGNKLSDFTHTLNIWAVKKSEIERGGHQVQLNAADFSDSDAAIFSEIERAYPESYIDSVDILTRNGKAFIFFKADRDKLTDMVYEALDEAADDSELDSPVYITFSEAGELLLD
jgi:hypothetical protein